MERLLEYSYDQATLIISREIVKRFKRFIAEEELPGGMIPLGTYEIFGRDIPIVLGFVEGTNVMVDAAVRLKNRAYPWLSFVLMYRPMNIKSDFNTIIAEIKNAVRHELEHLGQMVKQNKAPIKAVEPAKAKTDTKVLFQYFTSPHEVEAHVKGLLKQAKVKRVHLEYEIHDFVKTLTDLTLAQRTKIKNIYMKYAKDHNLLIQKPIKKTFQQNNESKMTHKVVSFGEFQKLNEGNGLKALVGKEGGEELTVNDAKRIGQKISKMHGKARQKFIGIVNFMGASCKVFNAIWANYKPVDKNRESKNEEKPFNKETPAES